MRIHIFLFISSSTHAPGSNVHVNEMEGTSSVEDFVTAAECSIHGLKGLKNVRLNYAF